MSTPNRDNDHSFSNRYFSFKQLQLYGLMDTWRNKNGKYLILNLVFLLFLPPCTFLGDASLSCGKNKILKRIILGLDSNSEIGIFVQYNSNSLVLRCDEKLICTVRTWTNVCSGANNMKRWYLQNLPWLFTYNVEITK